MACDGCRRTCVFSGYTSNSEHPSFEPGFKNHIMEALLDECSTFYRSYAPGAGLEPPE